MNFAIKVIANALVAALDFCGGALLSVAILYFLFKRNASDLDAIFGGIIGLAPDIDLPSQFRKNKQEQVDHHGTLFHLPLLMIPAGSLIGFLVGGLPWAIICAACLTMHYVHDMTGPYGGLACLWPFTSDYFGVNGREKAGISKREVYIRLVGHTAWIEKYWMRPSILSVPELSFALAAAFCTCLIDPRFWWLPVLAIGSWAGLAFCYCMPRTESV